MEGVWIVNVTYYLESRNTIIVYYTFHFFNQDKLNWLFGHYRTSTSYLVNDYINSNF